MISIEISFVFLNWKTILKLFYEYQTAIIGPLKRENIFNVCIIYIFGYIYLIKIFGNISIEKRLEKEMKYFLISIILKDIFAGRTGGVSGDW